MRVMVLAVLRQYCFADIATRAELQLEFFFLSFFF